MSLRPTQVEVWYRGIPYLLDLVRCRRALVQRQIEGELDSMESLAQAVGISRSTASRFFSGRPTSLTVTLKILEALKLKFDEVAQPIGEGSRGADDTEGMAGAAVVARPRPSSWPGGAVAELHPVTT
jgi:transcriptional regulator with XRE-family HTH domain